MPCLSLFLALLWTPTIFSKSQPLTSTSMSWRIYECTLLRSLVERDKSSLILKSQNIKGLWKAFCIISEGKNNTTERQHDFCSPSEKRGCLFLLLVKLHGGSEEQRPCWVTEESKEACQPSSACPWRENLLICKYRCAEQKGRVSIPYEEQQATDSSKLKKHQILILLRCLSLLGITGTTLEKEGGLPFSWSMCKTANSRVLPQQQWHMGHKNQ